MPTEIGPSRKGRHSLPKRPGVLALRPCFLARVQIRTIFSKISKYLLTMYLVLMRNRSRQSQHAPLAAGVIIDTTANMFVCKNFLYDPKMH